MLKKIFKEMVQAVIDMIECVHYDIKVKIFKKCWECGHSLKGVPEEFEIEHHTIKCWFKVCPHCHKKIYTYVML